MNLHRRERLRLLFRDLGAAAAFGSIAISGVVPFWALTIFVASLVLALGGRRILSQRMGWSAGALAIIALVLFGGTVLGVFDLVVAACTFAALVSAHRLLAKPSVVTDRQVHLTGLLMVAGGAALSGELAFAGFLCAYVVFTSLGLGLGVLESLAEPGEELPLRPALRALGAGSAATLVGGVILFILIPRLSWNVAARRASPGLGPTTAGFADTVRLGGSGSIKSSPRPVLRATLTPDPQQERLDAYWLGRTFDTFDGKAWRGTGEARAPRGAVRLAPRSRGEIIQRIELLPAYEAQTLLALDRPVAFADGRALNLGGSTRVLLVEVDDEEVRFNGAGIGYTYVAYSAAPPDPLDTNAHAQAGEEPDDAERYLQLPESLDPRVPELAAKVRGDATDPFEIARRLQSYLRTNYRYSVELAGELDDPLSNFLFERREGHCEHFATALAILLRTQGVPARVGAGFFGGERLGEQYLVRAGDAHAWTQLFVPGRGFVTLDATPDDGRPNQASEVLGWLSHGYDLVDAWWRSTVLDYSFKDQLDFLREVSRPSRSRPEVGASGQTSRRTWLLVGAAAIALYAAWRWRRRRRRSAPEHAATGLSVAIDQALETAQAPRPDGAELADWVRRVTDRGHPLGPALTRTTRRYLEARFGRRPLGTGEKERLIAELRSAAAAHRPEPAARAGAPPREW